MHISSTGVLSQGVGQQPFCSTEAIGLGGVEQRDTEVESPMDGGTGLFLVDGPPLAPESPRPEGDGRDLQVGISQPDIAHRCHDPMVTWKGVRRRRPIRVKADDHPLRVMRPHPHLRDTATYLADEEAQRWS
jgi:hypothetical protein